MSFSHESSKNREALIKHREYKQYRDDKIAAYNEYKTSTYKYDDVDIEYTKLLYRRTILGPLCLAQIKTVGFPAVILSKLTEISTKELPMYMRIAKKDSPEKVEAKDISQFDQVEKYIEKLGDFLKDNYASQLEVNKLICFFYEDIVFNFLLGIKGTKEQIFKYLEQELKDIKGELSEENFQYLMTRLIAANKEDIHSFKTDVFYIWQIIHFPKRILEAETKPTKDIEVILNKVNGDNMVKRNDMLKLEATYPNYHTSKRIKKLNTILKAMIDDEWSFKMNPWGKDLKKFMQEHYKKLAEFNTIMDEANKKIKKTSKR